MSDYTINSLPEEVLIEIFKWLDLKALQEVVLTCKKWRNNAEKSVPWSLKLFYDNQVSSDTERFEVWTDLMLASNRKYTTVTIDHLLELKSSKTMEIFTKFGPNITTLKLYCCNMKNLPLLIEFFKMMKNLKKLIILKTKCRIPVADIVALNITDLPSFPKLKKLEMIQSDYKYFELFKTAKLTSLKVMNQVQLSSKPLKNLLATQKDLKTLALRSFHHGASKFFETPIEEKNIPFKLKELSLKNIELDRNECNNLLKFINVHCKTIEKLELVNLLADFFYYEFVFAKMKKLKSLRLRSKMIPNDSTFFDRLEDNESVTSLTLVHDTSIPKLFEHLPNIEHLEILEGCDRKTLKSIAENFKKLKSLKVKCFNGNWFRNLTFPTLKALSIECVEDIDGALFHQKVAPGITHLFIDKLADTNVTNIMRVFKIESLTINDKIFADKEFFDGIRTHGSSMKALNLNVRSLAFTEAITDIRNLCFHEVPAKDPLATQGAWNEKAYGGNFPAESFDNNFCDPFLLLQFSSDPQFAQIAMLIYAPYLQQNE